MAIQMLITQAGLDALVDAQAGGTESIQVIEVGLTSSTFTMSPTITSLPGEFKRIDAISGASVSETIVHMTAQDSSDDIYDLRGIGLYLTDGTLFAVYGQASYLFRKVSIAAFLLALDIAFVNGAASDIVFGDATFLIPPATGTVKGVAEIATAAEATAGTDDSRIVTPLKLKQRLDALAALIGTDISGLGAVLAALLARTISGGGLVTGGGNLSGNRTLSVLAASDADAAAGTATDRAITPAAMAGGLSLLGGWNPAIPLFKIPGTPIIIQTGQYRALVTTESPASQVFAQAFPNTCLYAGPITYISADSNLRDLYVNLRERTATGFSVYFQAEDSDDNRSDGFDWIAVGY